MEEIIIGSRASELAMVQSNHVAGILRDKFPSMNVKIIPWAGAYIQMMGLSLK